MDNLTPGPEFTSDNLSSPQTSVENSDEMWKSVQSVLSRELSEQSYLTWFQPLTVVDVSEKGVILGVPDAYFGTWLKNHYQDLLMSAIEEICGRRFEVDYKVVEMKHEAPGEPDPVMPPPPAPERITGPNGEARTTQKFNTNYTFDNFVIGPGNRFAHAAAMAICDAPARQYNPLFIYGSVGLGKTHLMQSIAQEIKRRNPHFKVLYISSEKFTNKLINAIQTRSTAQFRSKYRTLDLLLIDDIHFIAEKESTQEEFFHTFNTLYDAHKQIIVSSDRPPKDISGLEERLVSRFGWGLVTDVQPPDFETRVAILKKKMEKETISVPDDVLYYIASKIKSNIRELEGSLIRVVAFCSLTQQPITLKNAQQVLKDTVSEEEKKISIDMIQRVVAAYFNLKVSDLRSKSRQRSIAFPRQIAMYLSRSYTHHSLPEIGGYFGGRDHTTVMHGINKIKKAVEKDIKTGRLIEEFEDMLKKGGV